MVFRNDVELDTCLNWTGSKNDGDKEQFYALKFAFTVAANDTRLVFFRSSELQLFFIHTYRFFVKIYIIYTISLLTCMY